MKTSAFRIVKSFLGVCTLAICTGTAGAVTLDDVERAIFPYESWTPAFPGYTAGMAIDQTNVEQFKEILDPGMYEHIKAGRYVMQTTQTESLALHQNYIEATRKAVASPPQLNANGTVDNFVAGRPFPEEPDVADPNAGVKIAWNFKYGYNWGDNAAVCPMYWKLRDMRTGNLERTMRFCIHFLNMKHRVNQEPLPEFKDNPGNLYRAIYLIVNEPFDLSNTQLLMHRYEDDLKRDDAWLYLGFQRRVRRLATGQTTDAFLGTDMMIEDFESYNARVSDYDWKLVATKNVLLPFHHHNGLSLATDMPTMPDGFKFVDFGGQGNCFPKSTWQLRKVYVIEAAPKEPGHPLSKRIMNIDAQTFTIPQQSMFDRKGELWKTLTNTQAYPDDHHPKNKGSGVSINDGFASIDVQAQHCTTGQFQGLVDPSLSPPSLFTVQGLRTKAH